MGSSFSKEARTPIGSIHGIARKINKAKFASAEDFVIAFHSHIIEKNLNSTDSSPEIASINDQLDAIAKTLSHVVASRGNSTLPSDIASLVENLARLPRGFGRRIVQPSSSQPAPTAPQPSTPAAAAAPQSKPNPSKISENTTQTTTSKDDSPIISLPIIPDQLDLHIFMYHDMHDTTTLANEFDSENAEVSQRILGLFECMIRIFEDQTSQDVAHMYEIADICQTRSDAGLAQKARDLLFERAFMVDGSVVNLDAALALASAIRISSPVSFAEGELPQIFEALISAANALSPTDQPASSHHHHAHTAVFAPHQRNFSQWKIARALRSVTRAIIDCGTEFSLPSGKETMFEILDNFEKLAKSEKQEETDFELLFEVIMCREFMQRAGSGPVIRDRLKDIFERIGAAPTTETSDFLTVLRSFCTLPLDLLISNKHEFETIYSSSPSQQRHEVDWFGKLLFLEILLESGKFETFSRLVEAAEWDRWEVAYGVAKIVDGMIGRANTEVQKAALQFMPSLIQKLKTSKRFVDFPDDMKIVLSHIESAWAKQAEAEGRRSVEDRLLTRARALMDQSQASSLPSQTNFEVSSKSEYPTQTEASVTTAIDHPTTIDPTTFSQESHSTNSDDHEEDKEEFDKETHFYVERPMSEGPESRDVEQTFEPMVEGSPLDFQEHPIIEAQSLVAKPASKEPQVEEMNISDVQELRQENT